MINKFTNKTDEHGDRFEKRFKELAFKIEDTRKGYQENEVMAAFLYTIVMSAQDQPDPIGALDELIYVLQKSRNELKIHLSEE